MRRTHIALVVAVSLLMPPVVSSQDVTEVALKAAYINRIVLFTEWPEPLPASEPFVICVVGDNAAVDALQQAVKGRAFAGRPMVVTRVAAPKQTIPCSVFYVTGAAQQLSALIDSVKGSPVLTISDDAGFNQAGGMVQFFFERGQLRFTIRLDAVKGSRLKMSSQLLEYAKQYKES